MHRADLPLWGFSLQPFDHHVVPVRRTSYGEIVRPLSLQIPSADRIAEPSHSPPRLPEPNARPSLLHALIDDVIPNLDRSSRFEPSR